MLRAVRGLILLTGTVRSGRFHAALGRSMLDMPLDAQRTIGSHWGEQASELAQRLGDAPLPVRVVLDPSSREPRLNGTSRSVRFEVVRDPRDFRGTGGVLRDLAEASYRDDDVLVVAQGAQWIIGSLTEHLEQMAALGGDVVVVDHEDGTPSGLMLVRCGVLRSIPATGFVDMKEQALPAIAKGHDVKIYRTHTATGQPVRMLPDYLEALRMHHRRLAHRPVESDPFAEELQPTFSVVEQGASVDATARVHDSVVLAGAMVEGDAVLVRSLVGGPVRVRAGQRLIDRVLVGEQPATRIEGGSRA